MSDPNIPQGPEFPQQPEGQQPQDSQAAQPPQVASPPSHPYAASGPDGQHTGTTPPSTPHGKPGILGILGMALGLLGALTAVITGLYLTGILAVFPGLFLGVAGISLSSVALGLRIRPMYAGIIGIFAGIVAVTVTIVFFTISSDTSQDSGAAGAPATSESAEDTPTEDAPEGAPVAEWPKNLATGGILFDETLTPVESPALEDNASPQERTISPDDPADIQLYVDYRCPVCALFETANAATLEEAVESGDATLEVRPLRFLDRIDEADQYSSRASSAVMCVASEQPEAAWDAHAHLLGEDVQPSESEPGLTNAELLEELDTVSGGLNDEARSCIESEQYVPFAQALDNWVFSTPVPRAVDPSLQVQGTPFAVVNGTPYAGSPGDAAAFRDFLIEQGVSLD